MAVDIAPEILNDIMDSFEESWHDNKKLPGLMDKLKNGTATYAEANEYAAEVGRMMKEAYMANLSSDRLPDGKCYYNIADKIIRDTEHMQYTRVTDYTMQVQQNLNKKAGIGLKAIAPEEDKGLVQSLINKAANADQYDDVAAYVSQTMESMSKKVVDHSIKANADFQYKAGMRPKIIRSGGSGCCEWCSGLSGKYDYPDVPPEVYARHNNCSCTVEYVPGDGKRQNVWNKKWISEEDAQRREELKTLGLDKDDKNAKIEYRKKLSKGIHSAKGDSEYPFSYDSKVKPVVLDAFQQEVDKAQSIFGNISTINDLFVLNTSGNDEGIYYDNGGRIGLRHADKKDGLQTMAKIAKQKYDKKEWSTSDPHHVMRHEIGHAIQREHLINDSKWDEKIDRINVIFEDAKSEKNNRKLPSSYAKDDIEEFISECIAAGYKKKKSSTVRDVIAIILEE